MFGKTIYAFLILIVRLKPFFYSFCILIEAIIYYYIIFMEYYGILNPNKFAENLEKKKGNKKKE